MNCRLRFLAVVTLAALSLSACDDAGNDAVVMQETARGGGSGDMRLMASVQSAPVMAPAPASAQRAVAYNEAPPSGMVLDRSRLGERRIAETHTLSIQTAYDQLKARYQDDFKKCVELGCEITNSNIALESNASIQARIAPDRLGEFLDYLAEGPGKIENHHVSADDYTVEIADVSAENQNLAALRERLRTLLNSQKTEKVDDILRIERELSRVQTEIDRRSARLRVLERMTQMATVNLHYSVEYRPAEVRPYELKNTWKRASQRFLMGVDRMIQFIGGALPWVPVIFVGVWLGVKTLRFAFARTAFNLRWPWRK